ncbi:MAG: coenzyme F420-0:L-glutamate ligase [Eubacteriales bacterium]|nr:coenzyme F420-0:L-glutamate ligase [Eubacteriales bacterium]
MSRYIGTVSRGIRTGIIKQGDDLVKIVADSLEDAAKEGNIEFRERDVIGVTEAVLARSQGNYVSVDEIAADVRRQFPVDEIGVIFPILSRNRFAICLRGIAKAVKKIYLMLSYPADEVGNQILTQDQLDEKGINPYSDVLSLARYRELYGMNPHEFTGVDYPDYYQQLIESMGCEAEIILANHPKTILDYTKHVLACDIHSREYTKRALKAAGAETVLGLDDIVSTATEDHGYNERFGLLGSNKSTEDRVKLFPRNADVFCNDLQAELKKRTGKTVEVLVYGDGAFKDPVGGIWELADPVPCPGYTAGLDGRPNELKLKYLADNDFSHLEGSALQDAIRASIEQKEADLKGQMATQGTTPRRLTDLIGSLCDLTSGSGDKGTPIIWIQGYFDNYATE